jgi:beta-N-acetylhexosaminidase
MQIRRSHPFLVPAILALFCILSSFPAAAQPTLRDMIGQMVMITFTGDSLERSSPSIDTLLADIAGQRIGGVIFFTWSNNLKSPGQIRHLTAELQRRTAVPLLIATDQEGGRVARLSGSNGFAGTPSAYDMGTVVNTESNTRSVASTMAGWFVDTGINMNLAPVVDVNVTPTSPAIGQYGRSFSSSASSVTQHAGWFIDEFRQRRLITTLKHFPGHGSAIGDSHLGFTDVTTTWTTVELDPFQDLVTTGSADAIMTAHIYNARFDSVHPATLSRATMTSLLRMQMGFDGVIVSDAMEMGAITSMYGFEEAATRAITAGVDLLLYTRNLTDIGTSLARELIDIIEAGVISGEIPRTQIEASYDRIIRMKQAYLTNVASRPASAVPERMRLHSYPNPFNGSVVMVVIRLIVPAEGQLRLTVYDLLGREVSVLHDAHASPGVRSYRWTPSMHPSGTYFVRAHSGEHSTTQRILYLQ